MISVYASPAQTLTSSKITNYTYIFRGGFERRALHTTHCAAQPVLQSHARHQYLGHWPKELRLSVLRPKFTHASPPATGRLFRHAPSEADPTFFLNTDMWDM